MNIFFKQRDEGHVGFFSKLFDTKDKFVKDIVDEVIEEKSIITKVKTPRINELENCIHHDITNLHFSDSIMTKENFAKNIQNLTLNKIYNVSGKKYRILTHPNLPKGSYLPFFMLVQKSFIVETY